ncbi:MAG: RraA family protein [Actinobacteria bacterium]|nr:RraA family protein [Actinomycetota bacterium]
MPVPDFAARFGALYTAAIADVLDGLGLTTQTLPPAIRPLAPGMRLAGPAFAVRGRPRPGAPYEASIRRILELLGDIPAGHVAVYATGDDTSAQFGELSATALHARGVTGVVLDGGCRDVDFIAGQGFPVFTRFVTPQDSVPRWEPVDWGHEVTIDEVTVATGDYVLGDADGVVVVPAAVTARVLKAAETVAATEDEVRAAVRAGLSPLEAYERFGKF